MRPLMYECAVALWLIPRHYPRSPLIPETTTDANRHVFFLELHRAYPSAWVQTIGSQQLDIRAIHPAWAANCNVA